MSRELALDSQVGDAHALSHPKSQVTLVAGEIGNGRATAILLARQGAKVALLDYNLEWAQETKRMIDEEGGISEVIHTDVTDEDSCRNAVEQAVSLFGTVHIWSISSASAEPWVMLPLLTCSHGSET